MPNNCGNTVTIIGPEADIDLFIEKKLSFEYFMPPPKGSDIEWQMKHWGTKWDLYDLTMERNGPNGIQFTFSTAWSPPVPFFEGLLAKFPKCWIKLEYGEAMMMLAGLWIAYTKNGVMKVKEMGWIEPMAVLTTEGEVMTEG
jgi:hypothetical protein